MVEDFDVELLDTVKGKILDYYLAKGWYRMGMYVFTTSVVQTEEAAFPVYWLRYAIPQIQLNKSNLALIKKNQQFSVSYQPLIITQELEDLHTAYYHSINFETSPDLQEFIFEPGREIFDSYVIEVREAGKLIAAGIFDRGKNSIAGIRVFFHPYYKKYSPGKYLILLKCNYCRLHHINWYYPGYFSPNYPKFDYKLFVDKNSTEVFISGENTWIAYKDFLKRTAELVPE
jgi:arginine-tRNA-protein transferase